MIYKAIVEIDGVMGKGFEIGRVDANDGVYVCDWVSHQVKFYIFFLMNFALI